MIFKDWAEKYFEAGIPVIPLDGKVPLVANWQVWSTRYQTIDEVEWLISLFPNANIGAVLGMWAIALDIDTDNEQVMKAIPYSPLRRVGKKGSISLFRPNHDMPNIAQVKYPIEVLGVGRQFVLPPSIHPETNAAYVWVGEEDILHFNFKDLPVLTKHQIDNLYKVCERYKIFGSRAITNQDGSISVCLTDPGRNNRLCAMAYAMACDYTDEETAIRKLLSFDKHEHEIPWFEDTKEPHGGRNPIGAATRMYSRAVKSAIRRGDRKEFEPVFVIDLEKKVEEKKLYPEPRGLMKYFRDYCDLMSLGNQDALGLGGAISLMSVLASNKYRTRVKQFDVWPNTFVINLASSGFGKETPQKVIDELLCDSGLLGSASYKSGTSIIMNLPNQTERIDVIDECSALLKAMTSKEDYKSEIVEILSSLYSKSSSRFIGHASRADGPKFGACWNPCVNILGSTTPTGFKSSVNKDMAAKGLMPRFLVFCQKDLGEYKEGVDQELLDDVRTKLSKLIRMFLSIQKTEHQESRQVNLLDPESENLLRYDPELIPFTDGAESLWTEISKQYFYQGKKDPESFESAFKNRFAQHVAKLALLDALSLAQAEITSDNVKWAHDVVVAQWEGAQELYELAAAENDHAKDVMRVFHYIRAKQFVSKNEVTRRFQGIWGQKLDGILKQLEDAGMIEAGLDKPKSGRPKKLYRAI